MSDFAFGHKDRGRDGRRGDECRGDLLARERRGELSGADCLAFRAHLADCSSCRVARRVFVDLDDVSSVDLRDGARIERMSNAARRWTHRRNRPALRFWKGRRRLRALGLAVCALLIGGTASATVWFWNHPGAFQVYSIVSGYLQPKTRTSARRWPGDTSSILASTEPPTASIPEAHVTSAPSAIDPRVTAPSARALSSSPHASGHESIRSPSRHLARAAGDQPLATPAALLRQASDSRRAGESERAIRFYRRLQQGFPDSSEAVLSSVGLGGLLLENAAPAAALAQFDAYLRSSRGGRVVPEALYGRARAMAALGDRQEERQTWERLIGDFSDSAYGPLARRRLADLR